MPSKPRPHKPQKTLPTREELLAFVAENPGKAGKREIARAFGITGSDRIPLKQMLRELSTDGLVEKRRNRLKRPGDLPSVSVLVITGRDRDGEILAEPFEWAAEDGEPPRFMIPPTRHGKGPVPGVGDQILARITPPADGVAPTARVIKVLERKPTTLLGVFRLTEAGARIEPVSRKDKALIVDPDGIGGAKEGDLVAVSVTRSGRFGLDHARVREVIGSMKSEKAVSLIAIHAHGIPNVFPEEVLAEAEKARQAPLSGREDWRKLALVTIDPADAKDHDDAVHAASTARRSSAATPSISPTGSCRCCPSAFPTTSVRCAKARTGRRSPCAWSSPPTAASAATSSIAS